MRIVASTGAGIAFGFGPEPAHLALVVPIVIGTGRPRVALACATGYAAAATLPAGLAAFDYTGSAGTALLAWSVPSAIVGLSLGAVLSTRTAWRPWAVAVWVGAVSVPPLSGLALVSPVPAAGLLYPGLGLAGVVLFVVLLAALSVRRSAAALAASMACLVVAGSVTASTEPPTPAADAPGIVGVDTRRGQPDRLERALLDGVWRNEERRTSRALGADTVVWPEAVYGEWTTLTGRMLELADVRLVGGARVYVDDSSYVNALVDGVTGKVLYAQRSPVPLALGRAQRAVRGSALDAGAEAGSLPALLCIELADPWLAGSTFARAARAPGGVPVIWAANLGWSSRPGLARRMRATARQWSRLFDVPLVAAVNHAEPT